MKFFMSLCFFLYGSMAIGQTVYKTPSGEKYHTAHCRMVKNKAIALTADEAITLGLSGCKICKPSTSVLGIRGNPTKAVGEKELTTQCIGKTKKGVRCKHKTKNANGYCYQHQP